MKRDDITALLDEIEAILKRDEKTVADLAREIERGYHQVYHWLKVRRFKPGGAALMRLIKWRDLHRIYTVPGLPRQSRRARPNTRKMCYVLKYLWALRVKKRNPKLLTEGQINDMILSAIGKQEAYWLKRRTNGSKIEAST